MWFGSWEGERRKEKGGSFKKMYLHWGWKRREREKEREKWTRFSLELDWEEWLIGNHQGEHDMTLENEWMNSVMFHS